MSGVAESDIEEALIKLRVARDSGDQLKADLAENALNDLIDRWLSGHTCHTSPRREQDEYSHRL